MTFDKRYERPGTLVSTAHDHAAHLIGKIAKFDYAGDGLWMLSDGEPERLKTKAWSLFKDSDILWP
jgi:hypothetical protein